MSDVFNIDELIEALDVTPLPITLGAQEFTIRRDLTGPEIIKYWELVRTSKDADALGILVGKTDGPKLNKVLESLPQKRMVAATRKVMELAGIVEAQAGE